MGFVGQPKTIIKADPVGEQLKISLAELDLDSMSPREAHQALYNLKKIGDDE